MQTEMLSFIRNSLIEMAEPEYQRFTASLLPGVDNILGVRLPKLRKFAGQISRQYNIEYIETALSCADSEDMNRDTENISEEFMEEVLLQGMVIGRLKAAKKNTSHKRKDTISIIQIQDYIKRYVPKILNWSTCDSFCAGLKVTKEYPEQMWSFLQTYLLSERAYDVRFGIVMIINYYIQDSYLEKDMELFDRIGTFWNGAEYVSESSQDYYVKMALAWAISICYVHDEEKMMQYLQERYEKPEILDDFTYNKALQKIVESRCVSLEKKAEIKLMKRKKRSKI